MKAIVYTKYGSPDVLQLKEVDKPAPKENEVLVRVNATTVNRTDCANLSAKPFIMRFVIGLFKPRKTIPGTDFAGKIETVGPNVKSFKIGDKIFGFDDQVLSSQAQYLCISEEKAILKIPENLSYEEAVACAEGTHYAYNTINKVNIKKDQKILINGATGAIGSATLQISKYLGAEVVAVCDTKNIPLIKSLGADRVIDYLKEDFTKEKEQYDYVFDTVGKSTFNKCKPILKDKGIYISSELGWMASNIFYSISTCFVGNKKVIFPIPKDIKDSLNFIKDLIEQGKFKAVIDRIYPLEQIADAYRYVEKGYKTGNVIIKVG